MAEAVAAVDDLRQVRPKVALSVHEKLLSAAGMSIHYRQLEQLGARESTTLRGMNDGKPLEL